MSRNALRTASLLMSVLAITLMTSLAGAATTGKLSGKVTNEKKEPLAGVNIRLEGQRLGAISDEQGNYFILGVPGGTYTVRANLLGQAPYTATEVEIRPDFTTTLNVAMRTEAVQMTEVHVEAERPLLQKDATGTTRFISSDDIRKLPTRGYRDAAANQTGIVNYQKTVLNDNESQNQNQLIIRGGRPNETAYFVDGFSQQDPLTGVSSTSISNNAIQEIVVLTGGFNPEYGRIMSGAVNVVTREGGRKYFGALETVSDVLAGDWIGADKTDYNIYDASLGGPLIPGKDNLTFYVSGERRWQRDRSPSFVPTVFQDYLASQGLDPVLKPNNNSSAFTGQGKLAWQLGDKFSLKAGGNGSQETWRQYLNSYLLNAAHAPRYEDRNQTYFVTANQVFSTRSFANVGVNFSQTERKRGDGLAFDRLGEYGRVSNPTLDTNLPMFWKPGHVWDDYLQRKSSYYGVQGAWTSQVNQYHQLKIGGDYQRHTLRFFEHYFPTQLQGTSPNLNDFDGYGYKMVVNRDTSGNISSIDLVNQDDGRDGPKHPKALSTYVQDKFEREGVIVNGGLRYDYFNVDTPALKSDRFPLGGPDDAGRGDSLEANDLVSNKVYSRLSPRVGVAFPVDEKTVFRFNYGQFYQQPNLQDLYVSYRFLQYKINRGGYFVGFGNPNLKPERTTAYEFGVARQFGNNVRFDLTAYYKDVKDLVEITTISSSPKSFSSYRNRDYATIKGVDMGFRLRPTNHLGAEVNYSLSFAVGTGSVSNTQRNVAWQGTEPPKQTAPLDFDQRHKLSMNLDWRLAKNEGPMFAGWRPFSNTGINVLYNIASGTPYTPTFVYNEVTLAAVTGQPSGPLNSRYGPWTSNVDLKATRGFNLAGLNLEGFVWVLNLLDAHNAITVYTSTGSPETTGWLNTADGQAFLQSTANGEQFYQLAQNNPNLYTNPRLVRFGLRTSF
jgi:outer membrane receptor protein involved in Fe transport